MNKKNCRDALDQYKKFLIRMDRVAEFLKVAEVNISNNVLLSINDVLMNAICVISFVSLSKPEEIRDWQEWHPGPGQGMWLYSPCLFCFSFVLERRRRKGRHSRPSEGIFCYLFLRFSALFLTCLHTHANSCLLLLLFALGRPPVVCWKPSRHTWPTWRVVKLVLPQPRQVGQVWHL